MKRLAMLPGLAAVLFLFALAAACEANPERPGGPSPTFGFPESQLQWINSNPLTVSQLKGKAVFLWFFEEDCFRCRDKWPTLLALSQRYANDPVVFIAVNSGTARPAIEQYVKECKVTWPVIVDPTREFEAAAGLTEIDDTNVNQIKIIKPEGGLVWGYWVDVEQTIDDAIKTATWKIGPKEIPAPLKPTWKEVEVGNYVAAAAALKKGLTSPKPEIKAGAEKIQQLVTKDLEEQLAAAAEALDAEQRWKAFNLYTRIGERFKGYEVPESVEKTRKALSTDPAIKEEIALLKQYEAAARQFVAGPGPQRKRGMTALEKLTKEKPASEAGKRAQTILEKAAEAEKAAEKPAN